MNTLIPQLLEFLKDLEPAPGVPETDLTDLLRDYAASVIQQDPTQATIPPGDIDPLIAEAIHDAVERVALLKTTFTRLRIGTEVLPLGNVAARAGELVSGTYGPFLDHGGFLVRFTSFRSGAFLGVTILLPAQNTTEDQLVIPAASAADGPDFRNWTLAPGTLWINSRFLVAGATGFTGLRIAGGTLHLAAGTFRFGSGIVLPALSNWSLSVVPEAAPPPGPGSDADALTLTLPTRLNVSSNGAPTLSGAPALSGFGSDLHFTNSGSPAIDGSQIVFPMQAAEPTFSIDGNASNLAMFSGEARVGLAQYALPISGTPIASLADAAHGGSLVIHCSSGLEVMLTGQQGGPCRLLVRSLTANAQRLEIDAAQANSGARFDFDLWNTSSASLQFAHRPISQFLFRSERGAVDTVAILGGDIRDKWDLPCAADGQPFPFEGSIDAFSLFSNPSGSWVTVAANAPVPDPLHGLALENLYLVVKPPRKLFFLSPFDTAPLLPSGIAILIFDVNFALPTLPDPYAANLPLPDPQAVVESALGVCLTWADAATPALRALFLQQVPFPEPRFDGPADDDDRAVWDAFHTHIGSQPEFLYLLDMSGKEDLLGIALESPSDNPAAFLDNRLAFPMRNVRLLMPPQVLWEPVQIEPNPLVPTLNREIIHSVSQGGPTLVGANTVTLVPTLPQPVTEGILDAIRLDRPSAALFSLPFGLRAVTRLSPPEPLVTPLDPPGAITELHEPVFDTLSAARQFRITARNNAPVNVPQGQLDPSRSLPGMMRQLQNLQRLNNSQLTSVTPLELIKPLNLQFANFVPLQHADLSGYGLSSFSQWILNADEGFTKAEFQVLNGRTAYEVLQFRSMLYEPCARVVRTVILERHTSGRVVRSDTGWVAQGPGLFTQASPPISFVKGAVRSLQNIRRIRITGGVMSVAGAAVQPVIFDADADIPDHAGGFVPIYDRPGYIQVETGPPPPPNLAVSPLPPKPLAPLTDVQLKALFDQVGPIGGPIDCVVRLGGTLETQLSSIISDVALDDTGKKIGFAVAVVGSPKLPRAGQWSVIRINPITREVSPVDPRRGVPVVLVGSAFRFLEPSDALRTPRIQHGLLMCTESSRVLFPQPFIPNAVPSAGTIQFDLPPLAADPYSLVQSTGQFPRPGFALGLKEKALFHIAADNHWRIDTPEFTIDTTPRSGLMQGGDWGISRGYQIVPPVPPPKPGEPDVPITVKLAIDSAAATTVNVAVPRSNLNLDLPAPLNSILKIHTNYETAAGGLPKLGTPTLEFSGALQALTDVLNSLSQLLNLGFDFHVTVTAGGGSSPSFVVHMNLDFRIGNSPEDRVDVGMGKFYGAFNVNGELEASLTGVNRALLSLEFQGDMQQGILPPLLYAGGLFRFSIELHDTGSPTIQLTLGVVFSIGGDLIPGLIAVEVTVHYGYTLVPETLDPGALIGLDARAKLLGGLIGFSFAVEAMGQIKRKQDDRGIVTIRAQIRVAGSVHVAIFLDEDFDFETQFQQDIPLAALSLVPGVGLLPAAASLL